VKEAATIRVGLPSGAGGPHGHTVVHCRTEVCPSRW